MTEPSKTVDAAERAVVRAQRAWEWWVIILSVGYFLAALIPWAQDGFRVVGR